MADAMLLVGDSEVDYNLYYKTHFLAEGLVYLELNGHRTIITSSMELGRARKEASVSDVRTFDEFGYRDLVRELNDRNRAFGRVVARAVKESGGDRVVVGPEFTALMAENLRQEGVEVQIDPDLLVAQRRQKSEEEIDAIYEAQRAAEKGAARAVEILRDSEQHNGILHYGGIPLTSERLRLEMEITMLREGMDVSHSPVVAGGPGAADPHWIGYGPLKAGEAVVMDIFPRSLRTRYWGDMTRTVVKGKPSDILRAMYDAVLRGQEAALREIRAGVNGRDVHRAVEQVFEEAGFAGEGSGPRYIHSTGHGVGLDIHEAPGLGMIDNELMENEVVTVEPGLYDPEIGGVRIEDVVVVTKDGYRNLTQFPKDFEI